MNLKQFALVTKHPFLSIFIVCLSTITNFSYADMPSNFPKIKPGLWETTMTMEGKSMPKMRQCIDAKMQAESEKVAKEYEKKNCTNSKYRRSGNTFYAEVTCKDADGKPIETKTESTFVSDHELKTKVVSTINGKTETMLNHTKRVGDCTGEENKPMVDKDGNLNMDSLKEMLKNAKELQPK